MSTTYEIQMISHSSNIRSTPTYIKNGSNVIGWTQQNEKYTASAYQNGWYKITRKNTNGKTVTGWVYQGDKKQYIKLIKTNTPAKATTTQAQKEKAKVVPPAPTPTPPVKPKEQTTVRTVTVPNTNDIMDHAIKFETDREPSVEAIYVPAHTLIFKDANDDTKNHKTAESYIKSLQSKWSTKNKVTMPSGTPEIFNVSNHAEANRYKDVSQALAYIRESQDIPSLKDRDEIFGKFNRYKLATPDTQATKVVPYIFFTKPDLNMVNSKGELTLMAKEDPLWESMYADEKRNFTNLDSRYTKDGHDFNCLLSNMAMSFQASDEVLRTVEHGETYTGWKMVYGRNTNESNTAGQFSIQYTDDHNFNIYKMHKIWVEYINRVYRGEMPSASAMEDQKGVYLTFREQIYKKVLTYPCAVYYIVCGPDGESILYWTKYYGVFPINTPASVSSWTHGSPQGFPEFSINYVYSIKEDFHPITLSEFNRHSKLGRTYRPIYNPETNTNTPTFTGAPYIETQRDKNNRLHFKLRFRN